MTASHQNQDVNRPFQVVTSHQNRDILIYHYP